jgi:tRNA modification GTPase
VNLDDTIAAVSSATGAAARMIVRTSGRRAGELAVLAAGGAAGAGEPGARRLILQIDDLQFHAWVYAWAGPRSYTGQDLVEFHIPGNPVIADALMGWLVRNGARPAEPGEFTARAFLSGRMDLSQAEGVAATIAARNDEQLAAARQLMDGELSRRLRGPMELLAETLALVEVGIDFSEEDVGPLDAIELERRLSSIENELRELLAQSERWGGVHEPVIVLFGRPNAGKSTLLNALAGANRAVVSPVPGTTRDALWAAVRLSHGVARIVDVAGLDEVEVDGAAASGGARERIEQEMRRQSRRAIAEADVLVLVREGSDRRAAIEPGRPVQLVVYSKSDICEPPDQAGLAVSGLSGANLDRLKGRLDELAFGAGIAGPRLALGQRHHEAIERAMKFLVMARGEGASELVASLLRQALDAAGEVRGLVTPDDILGRIFSSFCIGK